MSWQTQQKCECSRRDWGALKECSKKLRWWNEAIIELGNWMLLHEFKITVDVFTDYLGF